MVVSVCCIGAGPSGMSVLVAAKQLAGQGEDIEVSCYEKQRQPGGLWNLTWRTGVDEFGEPVHNSMYRDLFSNGPKECLEFPEYTFKQHFDKQIPSYPPRDVLFDYLKGWWRHSGVSGEDVQTTHVVRNVAYDADTKKFTVRVENLVSRDSFEKVFDYVIVANGHFSVPYIPDFKGMESFDGTVVHSHDFRNAREFTGKRILVVGGSYSAEDIAVQCHKFGAAKITIAYRTAPMGYALPDTITQHQGVDHIQGNTVYFKDGHSGEFDSIILCTGFQLKFPFLPGNMKLQCGNIFNPPNLYRGVQWCDEQDTTHGRLFYLAMCDQAYTFTLFKIQALWAVSYMKGLIAPQTHEEKLKRMQWWEEQAAPAKKFMELAAFQLLYIQSLCKDMDYTESLDVQSQFQQWDDSKYVDLLTYRNQGHKSNFDDKTSPRLAKDWITAMDDSIECFKTDLCADE